jgi:hypothetical protein
VWESCDVARFNGGAALAADAEAAAKSELKEAGSRLKGSAAQKLNGSAENGRSGRHGSTPRPQESCGSLRRLERRIRDGKEDGWIGEAEPKTCAMRADVAKFSARLLSCRLFRDTAMVGRRYEIGRATGGWMR